MTMQMQNLPSLKMPTFYNMFFPLKVQSDKASVTITSRYDGVIKQLHFEVDQVGKL